MREKTKMDPPTISFGENCVVLTRAGQSRKVIANVLGVQVLPQSGGLKRVWLDRLIHRRDEREAKEGERSWTLEGAISTVLTENTLAVQDQV